MKPIAVGLDDVSPRCRVGHKLPEPVRCDWIGGLVYDHRSRRVGVDGSQRRTWLGCRIDRREIPRKDDDRRRGNDVPLMVSNLARHRVNLCQSGTGNQEEQAKDKRMDKFVS